MVNSSKYKGDRTPLTSMSIGPKEVRIEGQKVCVSDETVWFESVSDGVTAVTLTLLVDDLHFDTEGTRCEPPSS